MDAKEPKKSDGQGAVDQSSYPEDEHAKLEVRMARLKAGLEARLKAEPDLLNQTMDEFRSLSATLAGAKDSRDVQLLLSVKAELDALETQLGTTQGVIESDLGTENGDAGEGESVEVQKQKMYDDFDTKFVEQKMKRDISFYGERANLQQFLDAGDLSGARKHIADLEKKLNEIAEKDAEVQRELERLEIAFEAERKKIEEKVVEAYEAVRKGGANYREKFIEIFGIDNVKFIDGHNITVRGPIYTHLDRLRRDAVVTCFITFTPTKSDNYASDGGTRGFFTMAEGEVPLGTPFKNLSLVKPALEIVRGFDKVNTRDDLYQLKGISRGEVKVDVLVDEEIIPQPPVIGGELMNPAEIERQSAELQADFEKEVRKLLRIHNLDTTLGKEWYVFRNELAEILEKEGLESGKKFAEKTTGDLKQKNAEIDSKNAIEKARVEPLRLESLKKLTEFGLGLVEMVKQKPENLLQSLKDKFGDNNVQSGSGGRIYVQGPEHTTWDNNFNKEEKDNTVFVVKVCSGTTKITNNILMEFDIASETEKLDVENRLLSSEFEAIYGEHPDVDSILRTRLVNLKKKYLEKNMGDFELEIPQIIYGSKVDDLVKDPMKYMIYRRGLLRYDPEHKSKVAGEVLSQSAGGEAKSDRESIDAQKQKIFDDFDAKFADLKTKKEIRFLTERSELHILLDAGDLVGAKNHIENLAKKIVAEEEMDAHIADWDEETSPELIGGQALFDKIKEIDSNLNNPKMFCTVWSLEDCGSIRRMSVKFLEGLINKLDNTIKQNPDSKIEEFFWGLKGETKDISDKEGKKIQVNITEDGWEGKLLALIAGESDQLSPGVFDDSQYRPRRSESGAGDIFRNLQRQQDPDKMPAIPEAIQTKTPEKILDEFMEDEEMDQSERERLLTKYKELLDRRNEAGESKLSPEILNHWLEKYLEKSLTTYVGGTNKDGQKHGFGTFIDGRGTSFICDWIDGEIDTSKKAIVEYTNGNNYTGFLNTSGERHGRGVLEMPDGNKIDCVWTNDKMNGAVEFHKSGDEDRYVLNYDHGHLIEEEGEDEGEVVVDGGAVDEEPTGDIFATLENADLGDMSEGEKKAYQKYIKNIKDETFFPVPYDDLMRKAFAKILAEAKTNPDLESKLKEAILKRYRYGLEDGNDVRQGWLGEGVPEEWLGNEKEEHAKAIEIIYQKFKNGIKNDRGILVPRDIFAKTAFAKILAEAKTNPDLESKLKEAILKRYRYGLETGGDVRQDLLGESVPEEWLGNEKKERTEAIERIYQKFKKEIEEGEEIDTPSFDILTKKAFAKILAEAKTNPDLEIKLKEAVMKKYRSNLTFHNDTREVWLRVRVPAEWLDEVKPEDITPEVKKLKQEYLKNIKERRTPFKVPATDDEKDAFLRAKRELGDAVVKNSIMHLFRGGNNGLMLADEVWDFYIQWLRSDIVPHEWLDEAAQSVAPAYLKENFGIYENLMGDKFKPVFEFEIPGLRGFEEFLEENDSSSDIIIARIKKAAGFRVWGGYLKNNQGEFKKLFTELEEAYEKIKESKAKYLKFRRRTENDGGDSFVLISVSEENRLVNDIKDILNNIENHVKTKETAKNLVEVLLPRYEEKAENLASDFAKWAESMEIVVDRSSQLEPIPELSELSVYDAGDDEEPPPLPEVRDESKELTEFYIKAFKNGYFLPRIPTSEMEKTVFASAMISLTGDEIKSYLKRLFRGDKNGSYSPTEILKLKKMWQEANIVPFFWVEEAVQSVAPAYLKDNVQIYMELMGAKARPSKECQFPKGEGFDQLLPEIMSSGDRLLERIKEASSLMTKMYLLKRKGEFEQLAPELKQMYERAKDAKKRFLKNYKLITASGDYMADQFFRETVGNEYQLVSDIREILDKIESHVDTKENAVNLLDKTIPDFKKRAKELADEFVSLADDSGVVLDKLCKLEQFSPLSAMPAVGSGLIVDDEEPPPLPADLLVDDLTEPDYDDLGDDSDNLIQFPGRTAVQEESVVSPSVKIEKPVSTSKAIARARKKMLADRLTVPRVEETGDSGGGVVKKTIEKMMKGVREMRTPEVESNAPKSESEKKYDEAILESAIIFFEAGQRRYKDKPKEFSRYIYKEIFSNIIIKEEEKSYRKILESRKNLLDKLIENWDKKVSKTMKTVMSMAVAGGAFWAGANDAGVELVPMGFFTWAAKAAVMTFVGYNLTDLSGIPDKLLDVFNKRMIRKFEEENMGNLKNLWVVLEGDIERQVEDGIGNREIVQEILGKCSHEYRKLLEEKVRKEKSAKYANTAMKVASRVGVAYFGGRLLGSPVAGVMRLFK